MSDKPTYDELMSICAGLAEENAGLRRQLELRGDVSSFDYRGFKIIVSPSSPPFVWNGEDISILKIG